MAKKSDNLVLKKIKRFWEFLHEDSWQSLVVSLILAFIFIKFLLFPFLTLVTGTALPLVIVESCSMHHDEKGFEEIFMSDVYGDYDLIEKDTEDWIFQRGFNKGDIIVVLGPKNLDVGDVLIFDSMGGAAHPIIHRVISITDEGYTTKGDNNNREGYEIHPFEKDIGENQLIGKAVFRVPLLGWVKMIFFDWKNSPSNRGFC